MECAKTRTPGRCAVQEDLGRRSAGPSILATDNGLACPGRVDRVEMWIWLGAVGWRQGMMEAGEIREGC